MGNYTLSVVDEIDFGIFCLTLTWNTFETMNITEYFIKRMPATKNFYTLKLQAVHTLPTDYSPICLITAASVVDRFATFFKIEKSQCRFCKGFCAAGTLYTVQKLLYYTINIGGQNTVKNGQKTVENRRK